MISQILENKVERTYKRREILEAVRVRAANADSGLIAQHERDLNDASHTSRHQRIPKDRVDHGTDHQSLGMRRHSIASHQNDQSRNEVPLRPPVAVAAQPHTEQTGAPPDNTHSSVLEIIVNPGTTPAVLGKGIDTAPSRNNQRIEELLTATRAAQPVLSNQQENGQTDAVPNKRAAHNKVRQTLAEMVTLAEAQ